MPRLRQIRVLGIAVMATLGLWAVAELFVAVVDVLRVWLIGRVVVDPASVEPAVLAVNDTLYLTGLVVRAVFLLAAVVVFLIWLFRARANAEQASSAGHQRSQLWLILGWVTPVVAVWFPKQIIDDIWRASDPAAPGGDIDGHRKPALVSAWWACWLFFWAGNLVTTAMSGPERIIGLGALESIQVSTTVEIVTAPGGIAAAVLAIWIVRKISAFQETRRGSDSSSSVVISLLASSGPRVENAEPIHEPVEREELSVIQRLGAEVHDGVADLTHTLEFLQEGPAVT